MDSPVSRRNFLAAGAAAAAASTFLQSASAAPAGGVKPIVIASGNGNQFKNGGERTCVAEAFHRITQGEDVLDAICAGINIVELDPGDDSVGFGGLPNADGVVQLDASVMHGPKKRAGAVACLEGVRMPCLVAKKVADLTDHHLIVGKDAQTFARQLGFAIEADLNTDNSRKLWMEWKRQIDPAHFLDPEQRQAAAERARQAMIAQGLISPEKVFGTIHCAAINAAGDICGSTSTSGLAWKIPGRVGDSPILGAGLWLDNDVGSAGSTGRGEANLYNLSSHLIVELLRQGKHPKDAAFEAMKRVRANTTEKRLLAAGGQPNFQLKFYVLDKQGRHAAVSMYGGPDVQYALCTENGPESLLMEPLYPEAPKPA